MMKQKRRMLLLLGVFCMLLFMPAITAKAEVIDIECGVGVKGTLDTGTGVLTISGSGAIGDRSLKEYGWFDKYTNQVYQVVIEDGITSIGNYAFCYLKKLQAVTIGKGVTRIGDRAFWCCEGLYSIDIPGNVIEIGKEAFISSALKTCTLHEGLKTIGDEAFKYTSLTTIAIPEHVESIGSNAFPTVKAVTIPYNITLIKSNAFDKVDATIYSMTVTIGEDAFGSGSTITAEHGSTADTYAQNHSKDVTIKYFPHESTLFFDANGGSVGQASKTVVSDGLYNALPNPVRAGYTFKGWYTQAAGGAKVLPTDTVTTTVDSTLYAHWKLVTVNPAMKPTLTAKKGKQAAFKITAVKGAKGYQVRYATNKSMKGAKTKSTTKKSVTIKKLKKKKTYYVQVRAYKLDSVGNRVYGSWSPKRKVKIKK